jgi:hypothetical protein
MALYRWRAARRSGARTGIDPTAQKLKADQIHGSKRGCRTGCPDGVARWGARRGPDGMPSGVGRRGARRGQMECPTGPDGVPNGAGRGAQQVARRCGQTGCLTGGQTGWPDGCHIIGHVIFWMPRHRPCHFWMPCHPSRVAEGNFITHPSQSTLVWPYAGPIVSWQEGPSRHDASQRHVTVTKSW